MGREIQKKKNRSSIPKLRHKPKSKKKLITNSIIAANWYKDALDPKLAKHLLTESYIRDKTKTLAQNYRRLGLSAKLNSSSGGMEQPEGLETTRDVTSAAETRRTRSQAFEVIPGESEKPFVYEVHIERDSASGKILNVLEDSQPPAPRMMQSASNNRREHGGIEPEADRDLSQLDVHATLGHLGSYPAGTGVVAALEDEAKRGERKLPRKQSVREEAWIERLVAAHGDDYSAMFKDRALNPMQQSEGDLRRRITKYLKSRTTSQAVLKTA